MSSLETIYIRPRKNRTTTLPNFDVSRSGVQKFATSLLRYLDLNGFCPKLNMIVVGISETVVRGNGTMHQMLPRWYSRGTRSDCWNGTMTTAVPIAEYSARNVKKAFGVHEFDPGKEARWGTLVPYGL